MSKENLNKIQKLKGGLLNICNKIETFLSEFKEQKEINNEINTQPLYFYNTYSKINLTNKLKQKITSLQYNLENIYNINDINKIESEMKKKNLILKKLSEEQTYLFNLIKSQKKEIDNYSYKFTDNKEINEIRQKLDFIKEENKFKKASFNVLYSKIKGQMSKIDVLEKQMNIIKQNIEYHKNKQKKEIEKSLTNEEDENVKNNNDNLDYFLDAEKLLISEIAQEEKNFQDEIYQQNILINNIEDKINNLYEQKKKLQKVRKMKKIRIIKYKDNENAKNRNHFEYKAHSREKSFDYNIKIHNLNKFSKKYSESPKNNINNIHIKFNNKRPFNDIKFNALYKNIIPNFRNKNNNSENKYTSSYDRNSEISKNEIDILNIKQQNKNDISNDIEKLRNEIAYALKNNVVSSKLQTYIKNYNILNNGKLYKMGTSNELIQKTNNKPFDTFNFG